MADKDIRLVIRARNQASKTLDSVNAALKELADVQNQAAASASKTDGAFGELGAEVDRLSRELAKLTTLKGVADSLQKAAGSVSTMSAETKRVATDFASLAREADRAAQATDRLKFQNDQLRSSYDAQKESVRAAKTEQRDANKELTKAEGALKRLKAQLDKQGRVSSFSLDPRGSARTSAETFLASDVSRRRQAAEAAANAVAKEEAALVGLRTELREVSKQVTVAAQNQGRLAKAADDAKVDLNKSKEALAASRTELGQIETAATSAAQGIGLVSLRQDELETRARQTSEQLRAQSEIMKSLGRFSTGAGGFANSKTAEALRRQRAEMEATRAAWKTLEEEARRLALAMRETTAPTQAQTAAFRNATAAARAAKAELAAQTVALGRLSGAARGAFSDLNRVDGGLRRVVGNSVRAAGEVNAAATRLNGLRDIFGAFYGESRKAMSITQRLRGEILSLATAYLGLYGAIQNIGGVITAFQTLEAAQNRLGAVFNQDQARVAQELDFVERQARRLGIEFGVLSNQYGKFSVAANAANFTSESTRKVFLSVAEAARVNKLTVEQTEGVFLALEQMISKGRVASEELRRQMGDRLPGAFIIFADAIGVTTAELDDMLQAGEVVADQTTLLKFADELNKRFGPQLSEALKSTTTNLGRFRNEIFQARLRVAEGGFIEGLNVALAEMNKFFQSREGRDFFLELGSALGGFTKILAEIPANLGLIVDAIKLVLSLKFVSWIVGASRSATGLRAALVSLVAMIRAVPTSTAAASVGLAAFSRQLTSLSGVATAARAALVGLRAAFAAATGIVGGVALFAITEIIGGWVFDIDDATKALDEHKRIMSDVIEAYEAAGKGAKDWSKEIQGATSTQVRANLIKLREELAEAREALFSRSQRDRTLEPSSEAFVQQSELNNLRQALVKGEISLRNFRDAVDDIGSNAANDAIQEFALYLLEGTANMDDLVKSIDQGEALLRTFDGTASEADRVLLGLVDAIDESGNAFSDALPDAKKYVEALAELKEGIPELANEMERLKDISKVNAAFETALQNASTPAQAMEAFRLRFQRIQSVNAKAIEDAVSGSLVDRIIQVESGGNATATNPNSTATGAGQFIESTWLRLFKTYFPDRARGLTDSMILELRKDSEISRNMVDIYLRENAKILQRAGLAVTDANLYLAHFLGPGGATKLLRAPTGTPVEEVLSAAQINANQSVLGGKTVDEVLAFAQDKVGVSAQQLEIERLITEEQRKQAEAKAKDALAVQKTIDDKQFEIEQSKLIAQGREREAAIEEAIRDARQANADITKEQLADVIAITGALFDQTKAAEDARKTAETREKEAKAITDLIANKQFEVEQNRLIAAGLERQAFVQAAVREASEAVSKLKEDELAAVIELANALFDQQQAAEELARAEEKVNTLFQLRKELMEQITFAQSQGDLVKAEQTQVQLDAVNLELDEAITKAIAFYQAIGGPQADLAIAKLRNIQTAIADTGVKSEITGENINRMLASGATNAFDRFAEGIANGKNAISSLRDAFLQFAADFLRQIAQMIIQQAILNALQSQGGSGGGVGGAIATFITSLFHSGGVAGGAAQSRAVSPAWFHNAVRYHEGGIAGLKAGEIPAILKRGEEILTDSDPRHIANGGGAGAMGNVKIINTFDPASFISEALNSKVGEKALLNWVSANPGAFKSALQGG